MKQEDLLDQDHLSDPASWDSKTRIKISDAIIEVNDHLKKVKYGRYGLIALTILNIAGVLIYLSSDSVISEPGFLYVLMGITLIFSLPYLLGAIFFAKNPQLWLIIGLVTYVLNVVLSSIGAGTGGVIQGFAWKIAVIVGLSYALYSAGEWKKNLGLLQELGFPRGELAVAREKLSPLRRLKRKSNKA